MVDPLRSVEIGARCVWLLLVLRCLLMSAGLLCIAVDSVPSHIKDCMRMNFCMNGRSGSWRNDVRPLGSEDPLELAVVDATDSSCRWWPHQVTCGLLLDELSDDSWRRVPSKS